MASALFPPRRTTPWWPYLPTTWAMAAEELFRRAGLPGRMIPVPSQIAAGCGLAWKALPQERDALCTALDTAAVGHSGRALCRLRYCHPPRRTLCAPSARSPRHGAAGRGAVQLLRVQLGGRGGHGHSGGKGTGTEQIGKGIPGRGCLFPTPAAPAPSQQRGRGCRVFPAEYPDTKAFPGTAAAHRRYTGPEIGRSNRRRAQAGGHPQPHLRRG